MPSITMRRRLLRGVARVVRPGLRGAMAGLASAERLTATEEPAPVAEPPPAPAHKRARSLPLADAVPAGSQLAGPKAIRDRPRLLLLNPPRFRGITVFRMFRSEYLFVKDNNVPPMDLGYFAAAARGIADVVIVDANAEDLDDDATFRRMVEWRPDVIVVNGVLDILEHDLAVPRRVKERDGHVRVILSCRGVADAEERVFTEFPFLDGIARGEVDAFAEDLANGTDLEEIEGMSTPGRPGATVRVVEDLDRHPIPDLDAMPRLWGTHYRLPYFGFRSGYFVTSSRGCPYACTFCMVGGIDGRPFYYRRRDPENVVEEVRILRRKLGIDDYYYLDEIFTTTHGQRVCERLLEEQIEMRFLCEGKPDLVNPAMLSTMRRAGCAGIYYGIESGDEATLSEVHKGHTTFEARRAIRLTREAGIHPAAYVMLGFPGESWRSFLRTVGFLLDARPDFIRYDFLVPYPITVLHRRMAEEGLLSFDRTNLDRRISPFHDAKVSIRSRHLGPRTLRAMDLLFKQIFADELMRGPTLPPPVASVG